MSHVQLNILSQWPVNIILTSIFNRRLIHLSAISCFDERLLEDPAVNRLEDSFLLWRNICSSKLLSKATIILFLNKCDILRRKLQSGVQIRNFLPSYGNRPNDAPNVIKCACFAFVPSIP
jgi:guanine nucleotide-binding protein subunit alpha